MSVHKKIGFLLVGPVLLLFAGCSLTTEGDFAGVSFQPSETFFAVVDEYQNVVIDESTQNILRSDGRVTLLFSGVRSGNAFEEWRRRPLERRLELQKDLAFSDSLLIENIPLSSLVPDAVLQGDTTPSEEKSYAIVVSHFPENDFPLGDTISFTLTIDTFVAGNNGYISGVLTLNRNRSTEQKGEIAEGSVTLHFTAPLVPERVGESNLGFVRPILNCAAQNGPARAGQCALP